MPDDSKTKAQLLEELRTLRTRLSELEQAVSIGNRPRQTSHTSEDQLKDIFENIAVGVYRTTPDGRILMANPALVKMLCYSSFEELSQRNLEDKNGFEPAYPRSTFIDAIEKEGKVIQLESAWTTRDRKTVFVSESARAVRDKDGRTLYYEGIVQDITEQKKAQEDVRALKQQMEFILGATKTGLDIIDSDYNIRYIDPEWQKVYGDPTGKRCYEYFMGRTEVCPGCGIPKALVTKTVTVTEEVLVRENNRPIQVTSIPFQNDRGEWLVAEINVDITERKKAEDALRSHEEMLQAILNATTESIFLLDPEGTILSCNNTAARRLGKEVSELVGQKADDPLAHQAPAEVVKFRLDRVMPILSKGEPVSFEDTRAGMIFQTSAYPVFDRSGKVVSVAIFGKDITAQKQAERDLEEAKLRYQTLFDSAPVGIGIAALDGRMLEGNRMMSQITGYGESDFCRVNVSDIYYEPKQRQQVLQRLREQGSVRDFKLEFKRKDGTRLDASLTVTPLTLAGQDVLMAVVQDISEREKMQAALQESETMLRAVFDVTTESILVIDTQSNILGVNKIGAQRLGRTAEELMGMRGEDVGATLIPPEVVKSRMEQVRTVVESGKPFRCEDERQGIIFDTTMYPIFNAQGKVSRLAIFARDITEQRRAEKDLKEAKLRYQSLFENAPVGIGIATRDGRVLECNSMMLRMTGYSKEELLQTNIGETYSDPEDRRILRERLHREGAIHDFEVQLKRKDGSCYRALLTVVLFSIGGQDVRLTVQSDITERVRMEAALRESEEKYRILVESAGESIAVIDANGMYLFINKTGAARLGGMPEDYIEKTLWDVFPPQTADRHVAAIREVIRTGRDQTGIYLEEIRDQQRWYNTTIVPLRDSTGNVVAAMVVARDIHDLKLAQDQLEQYRTNTIRAERLASLGTLSATIAHELTQPLTVVRLSIQNSLAQIEPASCQPTIIEDLKDGLAAVSTATSIIDRFRNFARQTPRKTLKLVNLMVIADKIIALLEHSAGQARVTINVCGLDGLPPIFAIENDLEQLFFALTENAIQAADGKKDRLFTINGEVKGDFIELQFADTCSGIKRQHLHKIFDPFFTTKPQGHSTGLGLSIVQRIVSLAGGKIHVASKWGKGTNFFVSLPLKQTKLQ